MKLIGFAGWSGAGKTTLLSRLIPVLVSRGLRVSTLKHAHHRFEIDHPGKDSYAHRMAGSTETLVASATRFALIHELRGAPEWSLRQLVQKLSPVDLVLVEGFKREPHPKIEVFRSINGKPLLFPGDPHIVALASDVKQANCALPQILLDDIEAIASHALEKAVPLDDLYPDGA
jgi:molybdopterin-guanine dinucleotide biosynthesis adapter protein